MQLAVKLFVKVDLKCPQPVLIIYLLVFIETKIYITNDNDPSKWIFSVTIFRNYLMAFLICVFHAKPLKKVNRRDWDGFEFDASAIKKVELLGKDSMRSKW